ncbi:MAG: hypothetical protein ACYDBV_13150 [Nitrospiria bacterium]
MKLNWIKQGVPLGNGFEEGILEIEWLPGIPMSVLFQNPPPSETDVEERQWLINESDVVIAELLDDPLTRKALFYNLHKSELRVNCMNLFHFTYREGQLNLYVYARSINLKNLGSELVTVDEIYRNVFEKYSKLNKDVSIGRIVLHIQSLHYKPE